MEKRILNPFDILKDKEVENKFKIIVGELMFCKYKLKKLKWKDDNFYKSSVYKNHNKIKKNDMASLLTTKVLLKDVDKTAIDTQNKFNDWSLENEAILDLSESLKINNIDAFELFTFQAIIDNVLGEDKDIYEILQKVMVCYGA